MSFSANSQNAVNSFRGSYFQMYYFQCCCLLIRYGLAIYDK